MRDQQQAFFIGGAPELEDMAYIAVPKDYSKEAGRPLNKYGLKTETSGAVKVWIWLRSCKHVICSACILAAVKRRLLSAFEVMI